MWEDEGKDDYGKKHGAGKGEAAAAGNDGTEFVNAATFNYCRPITILIC
jgi:hypothetical protein